MQRASGGQLAPASHRSGLSAGMQPGFACSLDWQGLHMLHRCAPCMANLQLHLRFPHSGCRAVQRSAGWLTRWAPNRPPSQACLAWETSCSPAMAACRATGEKGAHQQRACSSSPPHLSSSPVALHTSVSLMSPSACQQLPQGSSVQLGGSTLADSHQACSLHHCPPDLTSGCTLGWQLNFACLLCPADRWGCAWVRVRH